MKKFNLRLLSRGQKRTRLRILEIAFKANHSHIGSCLTTVDLIDAVYKTKKNNEKFVLSNGHAAMALYAILEKYKKIKNPNITKRLYIHPDRNTSIDIHVSTGSLGHGLLIAVGMAFANRNKPVYCVISDGECSEGSVWEAFRVIIENKLYNLKIILDANGWGGYDPINISVLSKRLKGFGINLIKVNGHNIKYLCKVLKTINSKKINMVFAKTNVEQFPFLKGQDAHYYTMNEKDYILAKQLLQ